jgi:hypothetical protein
MFNTASTTTSSTVVPTNNPTAAAAEARTACIGATLPWRRQTTDPPACHVHGAAMPITFHPEVAARLVESRTSSNGSAAPIGDSFIHAA